MLKSPRLKRCFRLALLEEERAILIAENAKKIVEGPLLCALLGTMAEGRTSDDIAETLKDRYDLTKVYYGLTRLEQLGLIEEQNGRPSQDTVFWALMGVDPEAASQRMTHARVAVVSTGGDASIWIDTLRRSGIRGACQASLSDPHLDERALTIVVVRDYLEEGLSRFNKLALEKKKRWLLCKPAGIEPWIGPLFIPGETGCWGCLAERLRYNRELEEFIRHKTGDRTAPIFPVGATTGSMGLAQSILSTAIGVILTGERPDSLTGRVLSFDWKSNQFLSHELLKLPHCPVCGAESSRKAPHPEPPTLISRKKRYRFDGGHRIHSPEMTFKRYSKHMSLITGVVSPLVRTTPASLMKRDDIGPALMRTYGASHGSSAKINRLRDVKKGIRSGASSGKGVTDIQARTSCLCEAIERVSGIFRGSEFRKPATYREVRETAFHPHELLLYSGKQYGARDRWKDFNCSFAEVPMPFDDSRTIDWSPVWSMTHSDWKYVPTAFLYYGYNADPEKSFCRADSNGSAAGNCLEEAVLQGLMELMERDAVALWWYNMIPMPSVHLEQMEIPLVDQFLDTFSAIGRSVWVLDLTNDLGVPVFAAVSSKTGGGADRPVFGFGAHLDPKTAITRALSEMSQVLGLMDFPPEFLWEDPKLSLHKKFTEETKLAQWPYLLPAGDRHPKGLQSYEDMSSDDLLPDVTLCVDILRKLGLEVLVHDQTRPDLGLNVVKVIVPGLRHFWARFAPGRLYDVPVKMGWLDEPMAEEDLNPTPMFI